MLIFKTISHLATALIAFGVGTVIVTGIQRIMEPNVELTDEKLPAARKI